MLPDIIDHTTEQGRTYTTPLGRVYPSLTTVLSLNDQEWLAEWRANVGELKAREISQIATHQGNAVHEMAERYLNNEPLDEIYINREEQHKFMFNQLKMQLRKHIDNIVAQEVGLYSDALEIAGRVDLISDYKNKQSIIDFKTATNIKTADGITNYFKQGAGYSEMWRERTGITIDKIVIIMAVKNNMIPLVFEANVADWIQPLKDDIAKFKQTKHGLLLT